MKKWIIMAAVLVLVLSGCTAPGETVYEASYLTFFDTLTVIKGSAESEEAFAETAGAIAEQLQHYHRLFDIYNDYEGLNNLKTVNDMAGIAPVEVDPAVVALLQDCRSYWEMTGGKVNVAMGSVLKLWHEERNAGLASPEKAKLPDGAELKAAAQHTDMNCVIIDAEASTVYISDPLLKLDVGAVAKGWAAQRVAERAPEHMLLSIGGNVCATGPKDASGTPWVIGVQNPQSGSGYLHTLNVTGGSMVTSGDYQRYYTVDGKTYHHIIDPETLMPARHWRSVTVACEDSGLADALSTALFLMSREAGQALLEQCGAAAMWVDSAGNVYCSPGFQTRIRD